MLSVLKSDGSWFECECVVCECVVCGIGYMHACGVFVCVV